MIKKIYDRDTGNIYDVGADNKLKLVLSKQINGIEMCSISELQKNKLYYVVLRFYNNNEDSYIYYCGILFDTIGEGEIIRMITLKDVGVSSDKTAYIQWQYNLEEESFSYLMISGSNLHNEIDSYNVEIYELPFNM